MLNKVKVLQFSVMSLAVTVTGIKGHTISFYAHSSHSKSTKLIWLLIGGRKLLHSRDERICDLFTTSLPAPCLIHILGRSRLCTTYWCHVVGFLLSLHRCLASNMGHCRFKDLHVSDQHTDTDSLCRIMMEKYFAGWIYEVQVFRMLFYYTGRGSTGNQGIIKIVNTVFV